MVTKTKFILSGMCGILLANCAALGIHPPFDPDAKETMVRVVDKRVAATDVRQSGGGSSTIVPIATGGRTLFIPLLLSGSGPKLTLYEYVVAFPNGNKLSVFSDYQFYEIGHCVKVFQSDSPTYPRLAPGWDCAKH